MLVVLVVVRVRFWRLLLVRVTAVTFAVLGLGGTLLADGHKHEGIKLPRPRPYPRSRRSGPRPSQPLRLPAHAHVLVVPSQCRRWPNRSAGRRTLVSPPPWSAAATGVQVLERRLGEHSPHGK
jgi:hypothetical protein